MANESAQVYNEYENALEKTKIQRSTLNTDGSLNYVDATYNALLKDGYRLGKCEYMAVSQDDIDTFNTVADSNPAEFAAIKSGYAVKNGNDITLAKDPSIHLAFTADQLKAYAAAGNNIVLMDDINVTESMGTLTSSLDGNGHTINVSGTNGVFNEINGGSVKNVAINADIKTTQDAGCLAAKTNGNVNIDNVSVSGTVDNTDNLNDIGGLIGHSDSGVLNIKNVDMNVTLLGKGDQGGILGCAYNDTTVNISNISGDVSGTGYCGGVVGYIRSTNKATISNVRINVDITDEKNNAHVGGIVQTMSAPVEISNCYVTGTLVAKGTEYGDVYAGGILGKLVGSHSATINNCYSDLTISSTVNGVQTDTKGDIVGFNEGTVTINNCASQNGTSEFDMVGRSSNTNFNAATNADRVRNNVSSTGNNGSLSQTYNPSDDTNINSETTNTVGSDYDHYLEIGQAIADDKYFLIDGHEDDTKWLTNLVNNGFVTLQKKDNDGKFFDTSVSTDTHLQEVADETGLRKAEAKYEADMKRIDNKDKKFDYDLAALDNERNAIKEEMETLKTVAKDNVERTFRLFS